MPEIHPHADSDFRGDFEIHQFEDVKASSPKQCDHWDTKLAYSVPSVERKVTVRDVSFPSQWTTTISLWPSYMHTMCCEA